MTNIDPAIAQPFDKAKRDELAKAVAELRQKLDDSADKIQDLKESPEKDASKFNSEAVAHKTMEGKWKRLKDDLEKMDTRNPEKTLESRRNASDERVLLERYLRAENLSEANAMLQSDDFTDFKTKRGTATNIPDSSFQTAGLQQKMAVASDASSGENAVDVTTYPGIIDRLLDYGGVVSMAYNFSTATGEDFNVPRADNTSQKGRRLAAQNTPVTTTDTSDIGLATMSAETLSSDRVIVTNEMIADSVFDIVSWIEMSLVRRIGRIKEELAVDGATNSAFRGVKTVAKPGVTAASATAITYNELLDMTYSIDKAYRRGMENGYGGFSDWKMGRVGFIMHDSMEQILMKLVDNDGRPLWTPSTREGSPSMIFGYPYAVSNDLDRVASGNVPLLFGNFQHFWVRSVQGLNIWNFWDSNTAQNNVRHVYGYHRCGTEHIGPESATNVADAIAKLTMG